MGAAEARARLFAADLRTEVEGEAAVLQALKAADPPAEVVVVSRPGWHWLEALPDPAFVTPAGEALGLPAGRAIDLASAARIAGSLAAGTLDGWRQSVGAAVGEVACPHWILGTVAAFAGPVLALTGLDTCGINLSGLSSSGKTTAQRLAASAWGSPTVGAGLLQSMRTTDNALESLSQTSSGTVLALDELAHVEGRVLGRMIYSLAGGLGKARMTSGAALRGRYGWSTFLLLSGECSLEEKVRGDGGTWTAGAAARIADVDVTGVNRHVGRDALETINQWHPSPLRPCGAGLRPSADRGRRARGAGRAQNPPARGRPEDCPRRFGQRSGPGGTTVRSPLRGRRARQVV